uniref:Uncharacterized protein n=1 Tax=Anopheles stephensi TaxID=30069 RepID=A0A182YQG1_ANOST
MVLEFFFCKIWSKSLVTIVLRNPIDQRKAIENFHPKGLPSISKRLSGELKNSSSLILRDKLTTREDEYASTRTNLVTTSDLNLTRPKQRANAHVTIESVRVLESSNNFNRKNFDLGTPELVFQDDSNNEYKRVD